MTLRGLWLALALFGSAPVEAAAGCHRYARWYYPWPQRCLGHEAPFVALVHHRPSSPEKLPKFGNDIPLPFLARTECVGGEADELTRARLELLGYAYAH